ncbi:MAG: radical SAM protein [Deltaproteobacteria bacterium]|nr:MAG: radical SAM protein [Deltaproteobacteria bacterium]
MAPLRYEYTIIKKSPRSHLQRFGKTIQLYAPLYLSNECVDTCTYCGFSRENRIERKTLTPDEVLSEAQFLIHQNFQHILLVAGEHPKHVSPDYLEACLLKLKPFVSALSIEVAPFEAAVYRRLTQAGLDGVVMYQETYDPEIYAKMHKGGPKKDYQQRILAPEEVAKAGVRQLGMGILLGLADHQKDAAALIKHVRHIQKKYWQTEITISLPRLRPCASSFEIPHPVSDEEFIELIAMLRCELPEVGIVLSTRESPALRDQLIGLGITRMSAGSRLEPGGYQQPEKV